MQETALIFGRLVPQRLLFALCISVWLAGTLAAAESLEVYRDGKPTAHLIAPDLDGHKLAIASKTLKGFLQRSYGWQLPTMPTIAGTGTYVIVGDQETNSALKELVARGLRLDEQELGSEGFRIFTHQLGESRFIILYAKTAVGIKHACQEFVYYRLAATKDNASVAWPLDVTMTPAVEYRACYMLPCWSAYDSLDSWRTTLEFNSELTLNRTWFWLNGFPLLPQYGGIYQGSDLGRLENVRDLIELCHLEGMKFIIGGGWFTWHHKESASGSKTDRVARVGAGGGETPVELDERGLATGVQYYLDLLKELPEADGLYLEPTGEGNQAGNAVWKKHVKALDQLVKKVDQTRSEFEWSIAIGRFNSPEYRQAVHQIGSQKLHWFWAWGNPLDDKALEEHPLVLRWHTTNVMSPFHGSVKPPQLAESKLTGLVTSWDPGMGFGNPWNGWPKIGVDQPRNFHPYTMPYFSHQYWFRERCWNLELTEQQFAARLARRLFDADMPAESIDHYLTLAGLCPQPAHALPEAIAKIEQFVQRFANHGTARNRDTLARMQEAIAGIKATRKAS